MFTKGVLTPVRMTRSGFWGGIALGRLVLPRFNNWFGERNVVFLYICIALGLEMVIWFAKQLIAGGMSDETSTSCLELILYYSP